MSHESTRKARVLEPRQVVLSHLPYLPHNNAFQRDGLAAAILRTRRMFTTVLIYHVVFCKAAAECYPLGGTGSLGPPDGCETSTNWPGLFLLPGALPLYDTIMPMASWAPILRYPTMHTTQEHHHAIVLQPPAPYDGRGSFS
jgi:hypothetical protein